MLIAAKGIIGRIYIIHCLEVIVILKVVMVVVILIVTRHR